MTSAGRRWRCVVLALVAVLLTACASMPTSGPVVRTGRVIAPPPDEGFAIAPRPPQKGASPTEVVQGFLDAMQATPIQATVARRYLARGLADAWDPQHETITYTDKSPPHGTDIVSVDLQDADHLDAQGVWQGPVGVAESQLHFPMVLEGGEWRIAAAPNALIVPQSWFDSRFTQVSLYFFDPTGRILVPEPAFVPRGTQLATTLVRALVAGPSDSLGGVVRTFLPVGVSSGLSVPVDDHGVAAVDLKGDLGQQSAHAVQLMTAQLAWTLRQDDAIGALRVSIGGRPVEQSRSGTVPITAGQQYDPAGYQSSEHLYGVDNGLVVVRAGTSASAVPGALGAIPHALRSVAIALDATRAAAVTTDGRRLVSAALEPGGVARVRMTGHDLLRPAWDYAGRLWALDRTSTGAVVYVSGRQQMEPLVVPGITGQNVRRFLVSRDGTRIVALVRHPEGDDVVVSRVRSSDQGNVLGAAGAQEISDLGDGVRIRDIGWHSPTSVVTLQQLSGTALIRTLSVDGAVSGFPAVALTVGDRLSALVSSPLASDPLYAVAGSTLLDLSGDAGSSRLPGGITALGYVG